jgi:hypothetical protein
MNELEHQLEVMLDCTRMTKISRCESESGPEDLMPLVHIVATNNDTFVALIPDRDYIEMGVNAIVPEGVELAYVGFCADAHVKQAPPGSTFGDIERGDLLRRFGLGDLTIEDALVVSVIDIKTGEMASAIQKYHYDDAGQPVFDEPMSHEGMTVEGQVAENLRALTRR